METQRFLVALCIAGLMGFAGGSIFGVALTALERRGRLEYLTFRRIVLGGGFVGLGILLLVGPSYWGAAVVLTILGTASALGTSALARRTMG